MALERGEMSNRATLGRTVRKSFFLPPLIAALAITAMSAAWSIAAPAATAAEPQ